MNFPDYATAEKFWNHNPQVVYLNHGSFGSTPVAIMQKQLQLRELLEADAVHFMTEFFPAAYAENKKVLAGFVRADENDLVLVKNATQGFNTVMHSINWKTGDEVLTHSHAYGACQHTLQYYAKRYGFNINVADVPYPVQSDDEVVDAFARAVTPNTRFALIDHVTSATGIIFPVKQLVARLEQRGVAVFVDGAHAPGMLDLDIESLGASYYTGNCHKWICTPKGCALLWVRKDKQQAISPLQVSHESVTDENNAAWWSSQFIWSGTDDFTSWLCIADAIAHMGGILGSWEKLREHNRMLCLAARKTIADAAGTMLPASEKMIGHLADIEVNFPMNALQFDMVNNPLKRLLYDKYKIQIPVFPFNNKIWVRISAQAYNSAEQYDYLAKVLNEITN